MDAYTNTAEIPEREDEVAVEAGLSDEELETDLQRLERALAACQDLQDLALKYGIADIFQDNGGRCYRP